MCENTGNQINLTKTRQIARFFLRVNTLGRQVLTRYFQLAFPSNVEP